MKKRQTLTTNWFAILERNHAVIDYPTKERARCFRWDDTLGRVTRNNKQAHCFHVPLPRSRVWRGGVTQGGQGDLRPPLSGNYYPPPGIEAGDRGKVAPTRTRTNSLSTTICQKEVGQSAQSTGTFSCSYYK